MNTSVTASLRSAQPIGHAPTLRIAMAIATIGRPKVIGQVLADLSRQTRRPDAIFVSAPGEADVEGIVPDPRTRILLGTRGLSKQRNAILAAIGADFDLVIFIDDDFVCDAGYVAEMEALFASSSDIVAATGSVLVDGIIGPGLSFRFGVETVAASRPACAREIVDVYNAYGCNMAFRLATQREHQLQFDEHLPLYAWLEDVDFSRQMSRFGRIVRLSTAVGVHLGVKGGRLSGLRLGYSQIANPVYLMRKGTCAPYRGLMQIGRNLAANFGRILRPEPEVDRVGRSIGNLKGIADLMRGRLDPERVLQL
jgi:GT2 family glycosyltransferase